MALATLPPLKPAAPPTIDDLLRPLLGHLFKMLGRGQIRECVALLATMAEDLTPGDVIAWQPAPLPIVPDAPTMAIPTRPFPAPGPLARAMTAPLTPATGLAIGGARIARAALDLDDQPVVIPADGVVDKRGTRSVTLWARGGAWFAGGR